MKTNQSITFNALNSHYLDTSKMSVCEEYLNDALYNWAMNTEKFYNSIVGKRRNLHSVVWEVFIDLVNDHIKTLEFPYHQDYYADSRQLKKWLEMYGDGYETLNGVYNALFDERLEYNAG